MNMKTLICLGLMTIAVFDAAAQRRGPPINMGGSGNPGFPSLPANPIHPSRPVQPGLGPGGGSGGSFQPGFGRGGGSGGSFQPGFGRGGVGGGGHHEQSNQFVGTIPYVVPYPVYVGSAVGSADDEQLQSTEDPGGLPEPLPVQPYYAPILPPAAPPPVAEPRAQIPETTGSADRTCAPTIQEDPVHFFIALKNGTVLVGLAYWVVDGTLHYLTLEGNHNQVSLDLIDRALSGRMNNKGRVPLILPR